MRTPDRKRALFGLLAAALLFSAASPAALLASDVPPPEPPPPPEQSFRITGGGNAHGVGLSQNGARGRANAGQDYRQIIGFYFSDHTLDKRDTSATDIRVLLATETTPGTKPVRIHARTGGWTSSLFTTYVQPFPVGSYLDVAADGLGGWTANAWSADGLTLLDSAPLASLVDMLPGGPETRFEMNYRDNTPRHNLHRGAMRIRVMASGRLQTINIVNIEDYLRGVVPCEINPGWAIEALKAQAVASRGYAMHKIKPAAQFDVYSYSLHQVYGGVGCETTKTNNAVAATAGEIVLDKFGNVAETIFHATAGGHTENSEFAWPKSDGSPGSKYSYLKGRPDVDADGVPYEKGAPGFSWDLGELTLSQLSAIFSKSSKTNVGSLISFEFKRGVSGRVYAATLVGSAGSKTVTGATFKNVFDNNTSGPKLKSTLFYFERTAQPQVVSRTPPADSTDVHRRATVDIVFSEPVAGVSGSTLRVFDAASGTRISGKVSYDSATLTARFVPDTLLPAGKLLRVELRTGVATLTSGATIQPTDWTFRVTADATQPTVTSAKTKAGSIKVYRDSSFVLKFSEPVVGVNATNVRLRNVSSGTWVSAKVTYDAATRTATLVPSKLLARGKTYKLVVRTGVQDLAGNSAVKFTWQFVVR